MRENELGHEGAEVLGDGLEGVVVFKAANLGFLQIFLILLEEAQFFGIGDSTLPGQVLSIGYVVRVADFAFLEVVAPSDPRHLAGGRVL